MPGQNSSGRKAATVVAVAAMIGQAMRRAAASKARLRGRPSAILRSASSTTTMAPSTSMPTAMIRLNSTTMLMVSPPAASARMAARKEPGMATPTSRALRTPRMPMMTMNTSSTAASTLFCRSVSMLRMSSDLSRE